MSGIQNLLLGGSPVAAAAGDPDFEYVTLLLPGNGTNGAQNNTFLDSSTNAFSITRNGNTTQGTFSPFSQTGWSNYFDGSTDYLSTTSTQILPTGDFTIEAFIYFTGSFSTYPSIFAQGTAGNAGRTNFYLDTSGKLGFAIGTTVATSTGTVTANAWNYVAVTRSGSTVTFYINGSSSGTATNSGTPQNTSIRIGLDWNAGEEFTGYISNLRISDNVRTITATPTAPYSSDANTKLLTCQSNRFVDNSSNGYALTVNGTPSVQAFSPFNPTAAWSAATNGGSGYFDGTGDYLTVGASADWQFTGDHTVECWVWSDSFQTDGRVAYATGGSGSKDQLFFSLDGSVLWALISTTGKVNTKSWNHIVATRSGSTVRIFINGVLQGTGTDSGTIGQNSTAYIGQRSGLETPWNGYIGSLRIIKGSIPTSYQTSSTTIGASIFTPPTSPLTTTSQGATSGDVKLLLNFTNAGIYDATAKNDLETVGNAQISTTQSKFGGSSMYFDGTGDWLLTKDNIDLRLGTGNFTIEFWVYLASGDTGSTRGLIAKGGASTGWLVSLNTTEKVVFTYTTSTITSSGAISTNAWNHIAVVREGTGSNQTKIYINGTNDGTGTVSTDFTQTENMYIGADRSAANPMKGFIDDLRITKGYARYTANFTAPTAAFPLY